MKVEDSPCPSCGCPPGTLSVVIRTWPAVHPMYVLPGDPPGQPTEAPCLVCSKCQLHARGEYTSDGQFIEFDVIPITGPTRKVKTRKY